MNVLHLNSEKTWRGGEQQMAYLMDELSLNGVKNHLGFNLKNKKLLDFCKNNNFKKVNISFRGLLIFSALKLRLWLKRNPIDIIHTHSARAHTVAVWANILGAKVNIVVSKRTDFKVKSSYKYQHVSVKAILCVSNKIRSITQEGLHPKKRDLVKTIYSGIDLKRFETEQVDLREIHNISKDKVLVGNCSALAEHKDYFTFINTASRLTEINPGVFHFIIMGDGPLMNQITKYIDSKMLTNLFTLTGFIHDIEKKLAGLDYFLMTSQEEGLGTSLLDAMICKVPIVSTNAGGIPEIIIHEQTGLLSRVKDHKGLSDNILRLLNDEELKNNIIKNAYENVTLNFSKQKTAKETLLIYKEILGHKLHLNDDDVHDASTKP